MTGSQDSETPGPEIHIDKSVSMSDKKKNKPEKEETGQTPVEALPAGERAESGPAAEEIGALERQLEESEARAAEYKDGWVRSQAEFQNYRKRIERDSEMMFASMKGDIVKKVLPALDDLERALQNRPAENPWADGIELIVRKLQSMLEAEGVLRIEAEGVAFDPNFHEAISHEPSETVESGHVIAVVQNGYRLGDRVIRPAMVRVAQ